jgi:hypothetical protein
MCTVPYGDVSKITIGEMCLKETACQYSLTICNVGATMMFVTTRASSIIEMTLGHSTIFDQIKEWTVLKETFHSDHHCIQFVMDYNRPPLQVVKNLMKTDWQLFTDTLQIEDILWSPPLLWDRTILESELSRFYRNIKVTLNLSMPSYTPKRRVWKNA